MLYKLVADTKQVQFAVQPRAIPGKLTKKKKFKQKIKQPWVQLLKFELTLGQMRVRRKGFEVRPLFLPDMALSIRSIGSIQRL